MTFVVQRLDDSARPALLTHFIALPVEDRRLRFGASLRVECIAAYVDGIDFDRDTLLAVHDDGLRLVGVAHVAFAEDMAELGLSVLPTQRGQGVGGALFQRAAAHARNRLSPALLMYCLAENATIMHMASRFGMHVVINTGDADARLELPPASPSSITREFVTERLAKYDLALKVQTASWKRINAALRGLELRPDQ